MVKPGAGVVVALALVSVGEAHAGGLARPNALSSKAIGMGGAFTAIADDPTALHYNPAGMSFIEGSVLLIGAEIGSAGRTYTPQFADGRCDGAAPPQVCREQSSKNEAIPLPMFGYVFRPTLEGIPTRATLGLGGWIYWGGRTSFEPFDEPDISAIEQGANLAVELVPGISYEVNDRLSIGAALRVSWGTVSLVTQAKPIDADLSGGGLGIAGNVGLMLRPTDRWSIGVVYRTALTNQIDGDGIIALGGGPANVSFDFEQKWPQSAALGVACRLSADFLLSAQLDWTDWSVLNTLDFEFPAVGLPTQQIILDWRDNYIVHLGADWSVSDRVAARFGVGYDSKTFPDRTMDRTLVDGTKFFGAVGAAFRIADDWSIDAAFNLIDGPDIHVPDNSADFAGISYPSSVSPSTPANASPGTYDPRGLLFALSATYSH